MVFGLNALDMKKNHYLFQYIFRYYLTRQIAILGIEQNETSNGLTKVKCTEWYAFFV